MPRMPDKNSLSAPGSFRSGRSYPSAGDADFSAVGRGLSWLGKGVANVANTISEVDERKRAEESALDLVKAESYQRHGLFETERQLDEDGDYGNHDKRYTPVAIDITNKAAELIRDPQKRELWRLRADNDIIAGRERLTKRADQFSRQERMVQLEGTLDGYRNVFTDPKTNDDQRQQVLTDIQNAIELGKRGGILTPAAAQKLTEDYVRGSIKQDAERRLLDDPDGLRRDLLGKDEPLVDDVLNPELRARPKFEADAPAKVPEQARRAKFSGKVGEVIAAAAERSGLDPELLETFAQIESGGDPKARTGSYSGLFQMSEAEFRKYGGVGDIFDPEANATAAARKIASEAKVFEENYGRKPTALDLYLVHQQGEGGHAAHTANPDAPAWQNMAGTGEGREKGDAWAKRAIWGNIPQDMRSRFKSVEDVTSQEFMDLWQEKMNRIAGRAPGTLVGSAGKGRYGALSPLERSEYLSKSERAMRSNLEGQRQQLKQSLDDDVESIRRTGVGATVDIDTASRVLEPNQVNKYYLDRQEAEMEHRATSDLHSLPEAELNRRLEAIAPKPGEALYEMKAKVFDKAKKRADDLREQRDADPARSVGDFPEVKEAAKAAGAAPDDPAAVQSLARARLDAQAKVGVPESQRSPITKAEARVLMAPVKGLEGKSLVEAMVSVNGKLEQLYGPYARAVGVAAVEQIVHNRELAEAVEAQINRAFNGLPASSAQQRRVEYLTESAQSSRAFGGQYVGEPMMQFGQRLGDDSPGGQFQADPFANFQGKRPSERAVQALIGNPALASEYNAKYGPGAAELILAQPR